MILFLKSRASDEEKTLPLPEKLRRIHESRVKDAETPEDRARAQRELDKFAAPTHR